MNTVRLLSVVFLLASSVAFAEEHENARLAIDWKKPSTLENTVVQICDDTYYPAIDIVVPGKSDFSIEMSVDITKGKMIPGCELKGKKFKQGNTVYTLDASDGGCEVRVYNTKPKEGEGRVAAFDLYDAC